MKCKQLTVMVALLLPLLAFVQTASAEKWLLAEEKDKNIRKVLEPLLPTAAQQFEQYDSDLVVVLDQRKFDIDSSDYKDYHNRVWWVARGEAEDVTTYVRDFRPGVEIKKVRAFRIRLGALDPSRLKGAPVEELPQDRIRIQKGDDKERYTNLVITFDGAEPGDLLGISIELKVGDELGWRSWHLAGEWPVTRSELRVKTEWYLAYNIFGHRLPQGAMQKKVLDEDDGHIKDIRVWVDRTDPIADEPYAPPPTRQSPSLTVMWRGERIRIDDRNYVWWYYKDWNQIAVQMAAVRSYVLGEQGKVREFKIGRDAHGEAAAAEWYHFLRDELLDVTAGVHANRRPTVDDVVEYRTGDAEDKAYTFVAALQQGHGLDPDVLWAHDPDSGEFFEKYPSWGQVSIPLVRVEFDDRELWYDFGCETCVPGEIRPELRDKQALYYRRDAVEKNEAVVEEAYEWAYRKRKELLGVYLDMIEVQDWCEWVQTPGKTPSAPARTRVTRVFNGGESGTIRVESTGSTPLRQRAHRDRDTGEAVSSWTSSQFDDLESIEVVETTAMGADTLWVSMDVECAPLPPVAGDTWVLPAEVVYGRPAVGDWPEKRVSAFHIGADAVQEWEVRVPLPEGWGGVTVPPDESKGVSFLTYDRSVEVADGHVIIRRSLAEQECRIDDAEVLGLIGKQVRQIHELETAPIVLQRDES